MLYKSPCERNDRTHLFLLSGTVKGACILLGHGAPDLLLLAPRSPEVERYGAELYATANNRREKGTH